MCKDLSALERARKNLGGHGAITKVATACDRSHQAVRKWFLQGHLPFTEVLEVKGARQTKYGQIIESLTRGAVTDKDLRSDVYAALEQSSAA